MWFYTVSFLGLFLWSNERSQIYFFVSSDLSSFMITMQLFYLENSSKNVDTKICSILILILLKLQGSKEREISLCFKLSSPLPLSPSFFATQMKKQEHTTYQFETDRKRLRAYILRGDCHHWVRTDFLCILCYWQLTKSPFSYTQKLTSFCNTLTVIVLQCCFQNNLQLHF